MSHIIKRCRISEIDRLSALPDSLLLDIIGRLHLKDAAKTAALSKQWRFLWTALPLRFEERSEKMEDRRRFVDGIRVALLAVSNSILPASHIFGVVFWYSDCFASDVDSWLDFAVKNQVKLLSLYIGNHYSDGDKVRYTLPQSMFSNSSLTTLVLRNCLIEPQTKVDWPCLKNMRLYGVKLQQRDIENILSGCPVLDCLFLEVCYAVKRLEILGQSLKHLDVAALDDDGGQGGEGLLEISAPYIRSLFLLASPKIIGTRKVVLERVPSLETARINIFDSELDSLPENVMLNTLQLLQDRRRVNTLHLAGGWNKVLSLMVTDGWRLPPLRLKELHIEVAREVHSINGVLAMLEFCPYVEKLVLHVTSELKWDFIKCGSIKRNFLHLKIVQLIDFEVSSNPLRKPTSTLARIILKRAPILEEIVIVKRHSTSQEHIDIIKNTLLGYPKSSMKASVKLKFVDSVYQLLFWRELQ